MRLFKKGGELNQGDSPMEFTLEKTNKDHTLDGYKIVGNVLIPDNKSSIKGYLKPLIGLRNQFKQIGYNLYTKLEKGGSINLYKSGGSVKSRLSCNKPTKSNRVGKKKMVKACQNGKEKLIHYGDANMTIKKHIPSRKKSFRARHGCDKGKLSKLTAKYWSCKAW